MTKILCLGDLHGSFQNLMYILNDAKSQNLDIDYVIQCGDFGFYQQCFDTLNKMNQKKFPYPVHVIDGNHEMHDWLKRQNHKQWEETHNIFYKPRGTIENVDGAIIAFMGGALNVDRRQTGSIDKRTTNYILDIELHEFLEKLKSYSKIDLMVTHSCPHSIGIGMIGSPIFFESIEKFCHEKGHSTGRNEDCGDGALSKLYRGLKAIEIPVYNWIYGHFHSYKMSKIGITNFYCIGCSDMSDNKIEKHPFIFDTKTKQIEYLNKISLFNVQKTIILEGNVNYDTPNV